jgi:hypothetical protein
VRHLGLRRGEKHARVESHAMVWVDILKAHDTIRSHYEHRWNGQNVVGLPRCGVEINAVRGVLVHHAFGHLPRETKFNRGRHGTIRQQLKTEIVLVETLLELRGTVGADRNDLITDLAQFRFDCVQLT